MFYKKSKREYIANYKKDKGKNPTQKEIKDYTLSAEVHLESYKLEAIKMVEIIFNDIVSEKKPEIENEILKKHIKPNFWYNVFTNIFASFLWAVMLVVMYFILSDYSFEQVGQEYFKKKNSITTDTVRSK